MKTDTSQQTAKDRRGRWLNTRMTKADVVKLVHRLEPLRDAKGDAKLDDRGDPIMKRVPVSEDQILAFAEYDDYVRVVTVDGKKLTADKPSG